MESRPPLPPFTAETAAAKVRAAEDAGPAAALAAGADDLESLAGLEAVGPARTEKQSLARRRACQYGRNDQPLLIINAHERQLRRQILQQLIGFLHVIPGIYQ